MPGTFTRIENNTFVPPKFRCMQVGVSWEPRLDSPFYINGERDDIVLKCQHQCKGTMGCAHFTLLFPNTCHLAGEDAVPIPAASATMSGPPDSNCHKQTVVGHTFMKKSAVLPEHLADVGSTRGKFVVAIALVSFAVVAAAIKSWRQYQQGHWATLLRDFSPIHQRQQGYGGTLLQDSSPIAGNIASADLGLE